MTDSTQELLTRIKQEFPELRWKDSRYVDEGWDHKVIILDDQIVFRFPDDDEYLALLKTEIPLLDTLRPLVDAVIPQYSYIAHDKSFAGYPIVPGKQLTKELFDSLAAEEKSQIAGYLARFMSTLHTLPDSTDYLADVPPSDIKDYQKRLRVESAQYLKPIISTPDYALIEKILDVTDQILARDLPVVFIHGDLYNRHLLWDPDSQKLGIIDFSDRNMGDPAFDFAELYEYGTDFVGEIYEQYTGPKDDTLLQRAWEYQRLMGIYMMVDHFLYHKTSFKEARETFDRIKLGKN